MAAGDKYFVGPGLRDKLREVIRRVDGTPVFGTGNEIETRLQDHVYRGLSVSRGTFTGSWNVGQARPIAPLGTTKTINVTNYCVGVTNSTAVLNVLFCNAQGTHSVIEIQNGLKTAQITVVTDVNISATLNTANCTITISKTVSTALIKYITVSSSAGA